MRDKWRCGDGSLRSTEGHTLTARLLKARVRSHATLQSQASFGQFSGAGSPPSTTSSVSPEASVQLSFGR